MNAQALNNVFTIGVSYKMQGSSSLPSTSSLPGLGDEEIPPSDGGLGDEEVPPWMEMED